MNALTPVMNAVSNGRLTSEQLDGLVDIWLRHPKELARENAAENSLEAYIDAITTAP